MARISVAGAQAAEIIKLGDGQANQCLQYAYVFGQCRGVLYRSGARAGHAPNIAQFSAK